MLNLVDYGLPEDAAQEPASGTLDSARGVAYKLVEYALGIWVLNVTFVEKLGKQMTRWIEALGDYVRFMSSICYWMLRGPGRFARQQCSCRLFEVGTLSIPVVMITGAFIGGGAWPSRRTRSSVQIGLGSRIGSIINLTVIKQIGPVLTSVMLSAGWAGP